MIFTRKDKIQTQVTTSRRELYLSSGAPRAPPRQLGIKPVFNAPKPAVEPAPKPEKKMLWGEPTWFLFHTIAEKVKPEIFPQIRMEILNLINTICGLLPCPICANHARDYMRKINFNAIQTKEQLKLMLWEFHNTVNERKGYPKFTEAMLHEKYPRANLINILGRFMYFFEDRPVSGFKQITDNFHRSRAATAIRTWFTENINHFDLSGVLPTDARA
jgi:hypothetical protein